MNACEDLQHRVRLSLNLWPSGRRISRETEMKAVVIDHIRPQHSEGGIVVARGTVGKRDEERHGKVRIEGSLTQAMFHLKPSTLFIILAARSHRTAISEVGSQ